MVQIFSKITFLTKNPSFHLNLIKKYHLRFKCTYNYPVRNVEITTLKNFYDEKPNGLKFNVEYCDTKDYVGNSNAPTVLAIHGSPGTHNDWAPYVEKLSKKFGVRFIAPNLPAFDATDRYPMYLHKVEEKAIYLNDFLKKLDINNIDMLLTHSSGVYPPLLLWNNYLDIPDNRFKSIGSMALFSPPGYRRIKAMRPKWFTQNVGDFYCTEYGRKLLRFTGAGIFKLAGVQLKLDNIDNLLISCITMNNCKEYLLKDHFKAIEKNQIPVFYSFSEDDRLIEKEVFYECLDSLNLNKKDLVFYNKNAELLQLGDLSKINKAIGFKKGGHYCFLKHNEIISSYLVDFFEENFVKKNFERSRISESELESSMKLEKKQLKI